MKDLFSNKFYLFGIAFSTFRKAIPNYTMEDKELIENLLKLKRYETTYRNLNIAGCSNFNEESYNKKTKSIEKKVNEIASKMGIKVEFSGEPRGYALRFKLPAQDGRKVYNNFDGESFCLNW